MPIANNIKGSYLEFIIRELLKNCGFSKVKPDDLYIFQRGDLTMIHGKGSAHDADVLMNPPIQMPFSFPFRLNFECKAYKNKIGLSIVRNALGLRNDINNFEIVTKSQIQLRRNKRRDSNAIEGRQRFNYQVGVGSIEEFTNDAFEFSANNKIPLISLRWIFSKEICDRLQELTPKYLRRFSHQELLQINSYLKGKENKNGRRLVESENSKLSEIYKYIQSFKDKILIGLLESGDLLFLKAEQEINRDELFQIGERLKAKYHYLHNEKHKWELTINDDYLFTFHLPEKFMKIWEKQNHSQQEALGLKSQYFQKLIVFLSDQANPFRIIQLDKQWIEGLS